MSGSLQNLYCVQGATFRASFILQNPDGSPYTIPEGATFTGWVKPSYAAGTTAVATFSSTGDPPTASVDETVTNQVDLELPASITLAIPIAPTGNLAQPPTQAYVYNLFMQLPSGGDNLLLAYGTFLVAAALNA
jgi:hypothetical protein